MCYIPPNFRFRTVPNSGCGGETWIAIMAMSDISGGGSMMGGNEIHFPREYVGNFIRALAELAQKEEIILEHGQFIEENRRMNVYYMEISQELQTKQAKIDELEDEIAKLYETIR